MTHSRKNVQTFILTSGKLFFSSLIILFQVDPDGSTKVLDGDKPIPTIPPGPAPTLAPDTDGSTSTPSNCNKGYQPINGKCEKCPAGMYAAEAGSQFCSLCDANSYSAEGADKCTACTQNEMATHDNTACLCAAGYIRTSSTSGCTLKCAANKIPVTLSDGSMQCQCDTNHIIQGSSACVACASNTFASADRTACQPGCNLGEGLVGGTCTPCAAGYYSDTTDNSPCKKCPDGSSSSSADKSTCVAPGPCDDITFTLENGQCVMIGSKGSSAMVE